MKSLSEIELIKVSLAEDMPHGDVTTDPLKLHNKNGVAILVAKQDLVLSGTRLFSETFRQVSKKTRVKWKFKDSKHIKKGSKVAVITGPLDALLKGERTALNFLGHLSGIATLTNEFVNKTKGSKTVIRDTRKTTPSLRLLEKEAVRHGGGTNHRTHLSEMALIKENHIRAAGSITVAVRAIRKAHPKIKIEVEVTNLKELREALDCKVNEVLLDNMNDNQVKDALKVIKNRCHAEASGNMTLDRIAKLAKLGVNSISIGRLTHSAPVADFSLLFK